MCIFFGSSISNYCSKGKSNVKHADLLKGNKAMFGEDINVFNR